MVDQIAMFFEHYNPLERLDTEKFWIYATEVHSWECGKF